MGIGEVGEKLRRSTVQVRTGHNGGGSGVVWQASGLIVTNAHVATVADLTVEFWDGRTSRARLDRRDVRRDLALLRVDSGNLEPAYRDDSGRIRVGELVIAVGNPLGFVGALSTGVVHAIGPKFIETTARLAPGNSGGPLADSNGNVIGINTAVLAGGLGLAVPASAVTRLLNAGPPVELGVTIRPVRIRGPLAGIALLVLGIAPGSPADYASLRVGDLLIGAGGKRFTSPGDLSDALDVVEGSRVTLQFQRGGDPNRREVTVQLSQHRMAA
jgi:serine protease Do